MASAQHFLNASHSTTNREQPVFGRLTHDFQTQICVVGAGIAGLTTAYLLLKEGKRVCVLEDFEIASGQSGRTTAQFVTALDEKYIDLEKFHGARGAEIAADSHFEAIQKVKSIINEEHIDCELQFLDGYLFPLGNWHRFLEQRREILGLSLSRIAI